MKNKILKVKEIFYSLQGEGGRTGHSSIFIRLAGCNLSCEFCDTKGHDKDFTKMTINEIVYKCMELLGRVPNEDWIVWTGGEPTLQLTEEIIAHFKDINFLQAIETNGTRKIPKGLDYVTISPKSFLEFSAPIYVNEVRVPYPTKVELWKIQKNIWADNYYLSPIFIGKDNNEINKENVRQAMQACLNNPIWKLSLQIHKLIDIR